MESKGRGSVSDTTNSEPGGGLRPTSSRPTTSGEAPRTFSGLASNQPDPELVSVCSSRVLCYRARTRSGRLGDLMSKADGRAEVTFREHVRSHVGFNAAFLPVAALAFSRRVAADGWVIAAVFMTVGGAVLGIGALYVSWRWARARPSNPEIPDRYVYIAAVLFVAVVTAAVLVWESVTGNRIDSGGP